MALDTLQYAESAVAYPSVRLAIARAQNDWYVRDSLPQ